MTLTKEQNEALNAIHEWIKNPNKWDFRLGGYAGTGKTFLLQHFINSYQKSIICCTPTGKASAVLSAKLDGKYVSTIHKLLYNPYKITHDEVVRLTELSLANPQNNEIKKKLDIEIKKASKNTVGFKLKREADISDKNLIIVDESSMVTDRMREDLRLTGCQVMFVGDPGQLPPVGGGDWFITGEFNYILQTVQRQALDSPILRMSLEVRTGDLKISQYQFDDCKIVKKGTFPNDVWGDYDQVLTGKNKTRFQLNRFFRKRNGFDGELPVSGEKMAFCKNEDYNGANITNGAQFVTTSDYRYEDGEDGEGKYIIDASYGGRDLVDMVFHDFHCRKNYHDGITDVSDWRKKKNKREIDFAYAITVHKSQGSEWDSVILGDDRINNKDKTFRKRWLYTAITRAKKRFLWVQD